MATGTGWTIRLLRGREADVTGVDIGADVIGKVRQLDRFESHLR